MGAPPAATLKQKRDVDVAARLVLGACDPPPAHRDLQAEESIGLPLPCTVVVRGAGESRTVVEALDPLTMVEVTGDTALQAVADDAASRLRAGLDRVGAP